MRLFKVSIAIFITLFLSGCATSLTNIRKDYVIDKSSGKSLVFGEVKFDEFQYKLYKTLGLSFKRAEDNHFFNVNVNNSTYWERLFPKEKKASVYFFVELPPGRYLLSQIAMAEWQIWWPGINFTVPDEVPVVYVGTLEVYQSGKRGFWSGNVPVKLNILDSSSEAAVILREKYPNITQGISTSLMKREFLAYTAELDSVEVLSSWRKQYGQHILSRIKDKSYIYPGRINEGKVFVELKLRNSGKIEQINVNEEKSVSDPDLQKLALAAVKRCGVFDKFPDGIVDNEAQFTVAIDFHLGNKSE